MPMTPAQMRADLVFLRDEWLPLDRSFSAAQRQEFNAVIAAAMDRVDTMQPYELELEIMRAAALAHNGHTYSPSARFIHALPVRLWWFADGLYVVSAHPDASDLLGARIEKLGNFTPAEALGAIGPFLSGTEQRIRYLSAFYLASPEVLHRIGATDAVGSAQLTFRLRDGNVQERRLNRVEAFDPGFKQPDRPYFAFSVLIPSDAALPGRWLHVLDAVAERPLTYRKAVDASLDWIGDGGKVLYVRSNQVLSSDQTPLDQKLVFGVLQNEVVVRRPRYVVVDLRLNQGGNFFNAILFTEGLPRLLPPDGRIFVLVGRATFSAALVTAVFLKANGGDRATLIGETMGDADRFWAEGARITLPNSNIEVQYANGFHDWGAGCTDLDKCYWPAVAFGVRNISLAPDVHIEPTFADYAAGRDPVLAAALARAT
jgi:hypothetical protein